MFSKTIGVIYYYYYYLFYLFFHEIVSWITYVVDKPLRSANQRIALDNMGAWNFDF